MSQVSECTKALITITSEQSAKQVQVTQILGRLARCFVALENINGLTETEINKIFTHINSTQIFTKKSLKAKLALSTPKKLWDI
jgi:hypothetical protein